jgi:hypothetical protein
LRLWVFPDSRSKEGAVELHDDEKAATVTGFVERAAFGRRISLAL